LACHHHSAAVAQLTGYCLAASSCCCHAGAGHVPLLCWQPAAGWHATAAAVAQLTGCCYLVLFLLLPCRRWPRSPPRSVPPT
jgi:hypothetical protein